MDVFFNAIFTPGLKEQVIKMGRETTDTAGMEHEMKLKPNWRARLVWTGPMPSEEKIKADEVQPMDDVQ